jgi:energy-coupling factor transporter ATP-binding protein EcfA2
MISFSKVSKQYGRQVLFVDASFQLNPGEKVGLVGPNGSGKTTLYRMIVGEEVADEGDVSVPKKLTIGYFRQTSRKWPAARCSTKRSWQRPRRRSPSRAGVAAERDVGSGAGRRHGAHPPRSAKCRRSMTIGGHAPEAQARGAGRPDSTTIRWTGTSGRLRRLEDARRHGACCSAGPTSR